MDRLRSRPVGALGQSLHRAFVSVAGRHFERMIVRAWHLWVATRSTCVGAGASFPEAHYDQRTREVPFLSSGKVMLEMNIAVYVGLRPSFSTRFQGSC